MMCNQSSSRRRVLKRAASVSLFSMAAFMAGCSMPGVSYDDLQASRYKQYKAASAPVPSEPVYGHRDTGDVGAVASYEPAAVKREKLEPVRVASLDGAYVGSSYAMQPVAAHEGSAVSVQPSGQRYAQSGPAYYSEPSYLPPQRYRAPKSGSFDAGTFGGYEDAPSYRAKPKRRHAPDYGEAHDGYYIVVEGDTVYGLAKRFGMTTTELAELNGIIGSKIYVGQKLRVSGRPVYTASHRASRKERFDEGYGREAYPERDAGEYVGEEGYYDDDRKSPPPRSRSFSSYEDFRKSTYDSRERAPAYEDREEDTASYGRGHGGSGRGFERYTVRRGDSLYTIAREFGLSHHELAEINDIPPSATLYPGQALRVPSGGRDSRFHEEGGEEEYRERRPRRGGYEPASSQDDLPYWKSRTAAAPSAPGAPERGVARAEAEPAGQDAVPARTERAAAPKQDAEDPREPVRQAAAVQEQPAEAEPEAEKPVLAAHSDVNAADARPRKAQASIGDCAELLENPAPRSAKTFRLPVEGLIVAKFGASIDGAPNDGVDFSVPRGTPVKAAENGVVAYVGDELPGFGNLILVRHADGYVTAYAHNDEVHVSRCDVVERGQVIAKAGATGKVTKPQLHFEIRKDAQPVDPEGYFTRS